VHDLETSLLVCFHLRCHLVYRARNLQCVEYLFFAYVWHVVHVVLFFLCVQKVDVKREVVVKPIQAPAARPSADEPVTCLAVTVSESLKQALANRLQQLSVADDNPDGNFHCSVLLSFYNAFYLLLNKVLLNSCDTF